MKTVLVAPSLGFVFVQIRNIHFFTFESIQNLA